MGHSRRALTLTTLAVVLLGPACPAEAGRTKAIRELARLFARGGSRAAGESAEALTKQFTRAVARHGDDALPAIRRVGPQAVRLADEAGEHGPGVMRLLKQYGPEASAIAGNPKAMQLVARHGDEAAGVLVRTHGVGLPLIARHGDSAVKALRPLGARSVRRLAILNDSGELARIGRTDEVLGVIGRYGDAACRFVWEHKAELAVATTLAAFLANPEPFINGTATLAAGVTDAVAEHVAAPIATAAAPAIARLLTVLAAVTGLGGVALILAKLAPARPKAAGNSQL